MSIEAALDEYLSGGWSRLTTAELKKLSLFRANAGWRVSIAPGVVACLGVDHFLLLINSAFPLSQPRVLAPQADIDYAWPHVESGGLLCLRSTQVSSNPGQRILQHICWAKDLLNIPVEMHRREFEREFSSYWNQRVATATKVQLVLSLLEPNGSSREIVWCSDMSNKCVIVAEDRDSLMAWQHNSKRLLSAPIHTGWLEWLHRPWVPDEFPNYGRDVIKFLPTEIVSRILHPGRDCPIVFGSTTVTGTIFVAIMLHGAAEKKLVKGFRNLSHVPATLIANSFAGHPVSRCQISRVDGSWVHGRDSDPMFRWISKRKVALIGCGSLGASIARLLAQAGVGNFTLVDRDVLTPQNTSRHVLGQRFLFKNKAVATTNMLKEDFPHIASADPIQQPFDGLSSKQLEKLADCDVIVSAGIDYDGDAQIDMWRRGLQRSPVHICAWAEEFAIVGHVVALFGLDTLLDAFDDEERVHFRLTDWPQNSGAMLVEAGCGDVFQPHGAIELQSTVNLAACMVLDVLCSKISTSSRRVWQGDRDEVAKHGGVVLSNFTDSRSVKVYPWR